MDSTILERYDTSSFRMAVAEMNGWRPSMEDAHLAHIQEDWACFGIFDGHAGAGCSDFVAKRIGKDLESNGCPADDAAVKRLLFQVDQEFLSTGDTSGSTGTMCIVNKTGDGMPHQLRIINVGDSRILLGNRDGSIVNCGGTDRGITTDHKPDAKEESERITRCGGSVEIVHGVARVNGGLAVSRAFGDAPYKLSSGGPFPEDRPVTVDPELKQLTCEKSHFLLLVCDGVSEGNFPNADVVKLAAQILRDTDDPGLAAKAVIHEALKQESHDNISCMVVLFDGSPESRRCTEFEPGTSSMLGQKSYREVYAAMADRAGFSMAQSLDKRYQMLNVSSTELFEKQNSYLGDRCNLKEELNSFGTPVGEPGSQERINYFVDWIAKLPEVESKISDEVRKQRMRRQEVLPFTMVAGKRAGVMAKIENPVAANLKGDESIQVDASKPITKIQIRFQDGSKKAQEFNEEHTLGDLRKYCAQVTGHAVTIKGGFPPKLLTDDEQSLKVAGLCGALVNVAPA